MDKITKNIPIEQLSQLPLYFSISVIILFIITANTQLLKLSIAIISSCVLNIVLRMLTSNIKGKSWTNPPSCGIPYINKFSGMPSGQAQIIGLFIAYGLTYIWKVTKISDLWKIIATVFTSLICVGLLFISGKCYTLSQSAVGFCLGIFVGWVMFELLEDKDII